MKARVTKTRKGAASIYIVIFTTTLLGIIALSFVRIMLAESLRTTNYSLSQSAYNSALAGVEDAKIVLLRYQSCVNKGSYTSSGNKAGDCSNYADLFKGVEAANTTAQDCNIVGKLLHNNKNEAETLIQTRQGVDTGTIDQAYTCVKIAAFTEDFLATLNSKNTTKLIPLRAEDPSKQNSINRIQVQWFDDNNYRDVTDSNKNLKDTYTGFWKQSKKSDLTGTLSTNKGTYSGSGTTAATYSNSFTEKTLVPPVIQVTMVQTAETFTMDQFYASEGAADSSRTNRGTLMLRPSSSTDTTFRNNNQISNANHSNVLPQNALAYSANKSFNTPIDVVCDPDNPNWGTYACMADFYVPGPVGGGSRNMSTSFLVVNLPYGGPETDISVKMYHCENPKLPISAEGNCKIVYFAGVQPMVDSTGRANDLFRRVESRIELADTNFPIANYALAMTDPNNKEGIVKDFYVTNNCGYSSSDFTVGKGNDTALAIRDVNLNAGANAANNIITPCSNARKNSSLTPGKGNGEKD